MGHIFISYSHKDTDYAHGFANHLQSMGFEVWIDERLDYGSQWPHEIQKQLDSCDVFILIMSPRSFASEWVQSELQRAKRKIKPIFPMLLEGDETWLSVESTQYYDVRGGRFPDDKFYSALKRVVALGNNSQTLGFSKSPVKTERASAPSTSRNRNGIVIAITVAALAAFVVCGAVFVVLFRDRLFPVSTIPSPLPATATLTLLSSPTEQATLLPLITMQPTFLPSPTLAPTETLAPTLPPPPTAAPIIVTNTYEYIRDNGNQVGVQRTASLDYVVNVRTVDLLQIKIDIPPTDNELVFHILLDDVEIYVTDRIGMVRYTSGLIDLSQYTSPGLHKLTISPEGIFGGSNVGTLWVYGATLRIETNVYP